MSNNLLEGYLWDALQDGVISTKALTEDAKYSIITKYRNGVYATPLSPFDSTGGVTLPESGLNTNIKEIDEKAGTEIPNVMLGYNILPRTQGGYMVLRYEAPQAFFDENISFLDFCVYAAQIMNLRGEPVLTNSEMEILTAAYGASIPTQTSDEYYDALMYLVSRGIIDSSYFGDKLYSSLTWKDAYVICSRIIDKDSRLTYKNVSVPFDASMAEQGYTKVTPAVTDINIEATAKVGSLTRKKGATVSDDTYVATGDVVDAMVNDTVQKDGEIYKTLYVMKQDFNTFKNANGEEIFPHISRAQDHDVGEYGYLEHRLYYDWDNNPYYKIVIYQNQVIPDCYDYYDTKGNFKQGLNAADVDYYLYATGCDGYARVANTKSVANNAEKSYVYKHTTRNKCSDLWTQASPQDTREFLTKTASITYTPAAITETTTESTTKEGDTETTTKSSSSSSSSSSSTTSAGQQIVVSFDIPATGFKNITSINGITKDKFETVTTSPDYKNHCYYKEIKSGDETKMYRVYMQINDTDEIEASIASKITWASASTDNAIAYVRSRSDTNDIYYGSNFLANKAGIQVIKNSENKYFTITTPYETMKLYYDADNGWTLYSSNTILVFSKDVDAIKENTAENTTDAYFVHSLLVEKYLRSTYKKGWSSYITANGILNLGSLSDGEDKQGKWVFTAVDNAKCRNIMSPEYYDYTTDSSGVSSSTAPVFSVSVDSAKYYYMDLAQVPEQLTNYIIVWQVNSMKDITAEVIEVVPKDVATSYTTGGEGSAVLKDLLNRASGITTGNLNLDANFNYVNLKAKLYSSISGDNPHTVTKLEKSDNYTVLSRLVYDPTTFSLLYRIPTSNGTFDKSIVEQVSLLKNDDGSMKTFGLPYIFNVDNSDNSLVFLNLPYNKDANSSDNLTYSKGAMSIESFNQTALTSLRDKIYNYGKDELSSSVGWFPVMPLITIQARQSDEVSNYVNYMTTQKVYEDLGKQISYVAIVGPWQVGAKASSASSNYIESKVSISQKGLYESILGDIAKEESTTTLYKPSNENKVYVIRKQHLNVIYTADLCLADTSATDGLLNSASKMAASVVSTVVDFLDKIYQAEKLLDTKFCDVNDFLALCYWVVIILIPRFLFGLLFIYQLMSLVVHVKFVQVFCDKVFDVYKFLTFGRMPFSAVEPKKLWTTGMVGSVLIILISRDYGWKFLDWIISNVLNIISRM
jgi:hypothetical protein